MPSWKDWGREAFPTQEQWTGGGKFHGLYRKQLPLPVKETRHDIMFTNNFSCFRDVLSPEISKERREGALKYNIVTQTFYQLVHLFHEGSDTFLKVLSQTLKCKETVKYNEGIWSGCT